MDDEFLLVPEVVAIFPLPQVVLFPRTIRPLHVHEPRYREMVADALATERILATALLKPGFEPLYHTRRAPIYKTLGLGQIVESEQRDDGDYTILLRGIGRAVIVNELPEEEAAERPYRRAQIEPVQTFCSGDESGADQLRRQLFSAIRGNLAFDPDLRKHWLKLRRADLDLDTVADLLAAGVPVEAELQQLLLEEADAFQRAKLLLDQVRTLGTIARRQLHIPKPDEYNFN